MDNNSWYYCNSCNRWWQNCKDHVHYTHINPLVSKRKTCPECLPATQEIVQEEPPMEIKEQKNQRWKLTPQRKEELYKDLAAGMSNTECVKKYNLASPTITYHRKQFNKKHPGFSPKSGQKEPTTNQNKTPKTIDVLAAIPDTYNIEKNKSHDTLNNEISRLNDTIDYLYRNIQEKKLHILKLDSLLKTNKMIDNDLHHSPTALLEEVETDRPALIETINIILKVISILVDNILILQEEITQLKDLKNERKAG